MVRSPCCEKNNLKKGPWTPEEDQKLVDYIKRHGHGSWRALPKLAGLNRCGKSCRLRWINYLRPDIKRGRFSEEEERLIINLHSVLGNKWSRIASHLPGRTDNEIKNFWNTHIRKKLLQMGIDPITHKPRTDPNHLLNLSQMLFSSPFGNPMMSPWDNVLRLQTDATQIAKIQLLQNLLQLMNNTSTVPNIENNSGLFGLQNMTSLTGLVNKEPNVIAQAPLNPGSSPQSTNEQQVLTNSSTWFERGLNQLQGLDITNNSFTLDSSYDNIQQESKLPPLIFASSETSTPSQIEKKSTETHQLSPSSPISTCFETWENFIDYETSDSYWKNILDFTSSSSSISNVLVDHL